LNITADILKTYLKRLTNLGSRNRSLLLGSLPAEQFLDLHELDFLDNFASFELIRQLIAQKNTVKLCDVADPRFHKINEVSKKLRKIARTEQFIEEERGAEDLYVGWPFVRGKLMDGTLIHGPLAFFAVTLQQTDKHWQLRRRQEPAMLNRSFLLAYSHFNQVLLPEELLETNLNELDRDALNFRTQLYELLRDSPLKINFNQAIFQEKLQPFDLLKPADLDLLERNGELKLYSEAVLGIFPQAGSYLAPDYEALLAQWPSQQEGFFASTDHSAGAMPKEEHTFAAFAQDASQEQALQRVKAGESLVVQGPPGTGKSQLIANLMADFAARGQRVLLVCQKRVALDVVYDRLQSVGMQPFVALIHDFKNDRAALYGQLASQINEVEGYQKQNYSLDAIFLERKFLQTSRAIEQTAAELQDFRNALFDESACGLSAKELYLTSNPNAPHVALGNDFKWFRFDDSLDNFLQRIRQYEAYSKRHTPAHPWHERVNFANFGTKEIPAIEAVLQEIPAWLAQTGFELETLLTGAKKAAELEIWLDLLKDQGTWHLFKKWNEGFFTVIQKMTCQSQIENLADLAKRGVVGNELSSTDLEVFLPRLQRLIEARNAWTKWVFYGDKNYFKPILAQYNLSFEPTDLSKLNERVVNRLSWESTLESLGKSLDLNLRQPLLAQSQGQLEVFLQQFKNAENAHRQLKNEFECINESDFSQLQNRVRKFLKFSIETHQKYQLWRQYLTEFQIINSKDPIINSKYQSTLRQDFDLLVAADRLKADFSELEWRIIELTCASEVLFQNSLRLAWLQQLETTRPILCAVSSLNISQLEESLQQNVAQKQALSREILLLKLREQTYQSLAFNRLQNRLTYRDLQHQVSKKRKIWPVRKLIENHADDIFKLVPCWLASPESVSAMFPLVAGLFDLVIFDEASQCYAEYGLPALFRGKQAVVAGDSKQLTPTDLYRVRYEPETTDDNAALDVESLLDLATQYLPQAQLQGHYRSHSLDLIAFSNQYFYRNKLELLPYFEQINRQEPAIKYLKVAGTWQHNTNQVEVDCVVALIEKLQETQPQKSIGVVTFNHPQQQLIAEKQQILGSSLFVKNIENVQGDERDIIIFSIGYAPDPQGKLRAQFGTLNAQGGENRLNVAITRARERVYVITSIWPSQLQVEDTAHEGPKLLKKYLEYALEVSEGRFVAQPKVIDGYRNTPFLKEKIKANALESELENTPPQKICEELPFADLTIKSQSGAYESLILTDDAPYFQSQSAKEIHAYWPLNLQAKGWPFVRVWSREWWRKQ